MYKEYLGNVDANILIRWASSCGLLVFVHGLEVTVNQEGEKRR